MPEEIPPCPVECPNRQKTVIGKGYSIFALLATIPAVLLAGVIFSLRVDYKCITKSSHSKCTSHIEWLGWQGVPLQAIATALGTGLIVYGGKDKWAENLGHLIKGNSNSSGN